MPGKLTIIRHDKIPAILGIQDFVQLENLYKTEAKLLISQPAMKAFFKPNDLETARKISEMLGNTLVNDNKVTSAGQLKDSKDKEPLLSVDDLLNLGVIDESKAEVEGGKPNMIVFLPGTRPVQVRALSWQNYQEQTDPVNYPPPERKLLEVDETLVRSKPQSEAPEASKTQEDESSADDQVSTDEDENGDSQLGFMQW
jgi:type IV secretory pathway TraG/TraD family ATPase VirD4